MPTAVAISGTGVVNNKLTLIEKDSTKLTATVTPDDAVSKNVTHSPPMSPWPRSPQTVL